MRWVPLLAVLLLGARPAAAQTCAVPTWVEPGTPSTAAVVFDSASPECVAASSLSADFAKIRAAAGFTSAMLAFYIDPDPEENAYYLMNRVAFNAGYLRSNIPREGRLATLGHEVGHAVQDQTKKFAWRDEPWQAYRARAGDSATWAAFQQAPESAEYYARSRRLESHADLIGQELLTRAGYDPNTFTRGRAARFGCGADLLTVRDDTHPPTAQRYVNAAMGRGALSSNRARREADRIMEGLGGPRRLPGGELATPVPVAYSPSARVEDFDATGRLRPGRAAAEALRVPDPPRDAGPVREHAQFIAGSVVDFWIARPFQAAVDGLAERRAIASRAIAACGTPEASRFAEEYGTAGWIRRIAADWAANLARRRDTPRLVSGAVPG